MDTAPLAYRESAIAPQGVRLSRRVRLLGIAACVLAFAGLAVGVETAILTPLDLGFSTLLAPFRTAWLVAIFVAITSMGAEGSLAGMALVASAAFWACGRGRNLLPLWVTFLGAEAVTWTAKYLLDRERPLVLSGLSPALSPSFPSAHTTGTTALVGILACLIARELPDRRHRGRVAGTAIATAGLIGFSRLFLNLHYLSDVLAGALVAGVWLLIGSAMIEPSPTGPQQPW